MESRGGRRGSTRREVNEKKRKSLFLKTLEKTLKKNKTKMKGKQDERQ